MKRNLAIRCLLAVLMIAGLALAPLSRPVMAAAPSDMSMPVTDQMSAAAMSETMAGDMPCCPSKAPTPADCDKCVYVAACASKCFTGITAGIFHPLFAVSNHVLPLSNDSSPDGTGHPPPDHPPRILV